MARASQLKQPADQPAAVDLDVLLAQIAAMNIEDLRARWKQSRGKPAPPALSRDLMARALAYWLQEQHLGGLDRQSLKVLASLSKGIDVPPARRIKVGSVIVREYLGTLHEVLVVPNGFCWQGQTFASLSTIARKITGTSWNGPRFFGLRGAGMDGTGAVPDAAAPKSVEKVAPAPRGSINTGRKSRKLGAVP